VLTSVDRAQVYTWKLAPEDITIAASL